MATKRKPIERNVRQRITPEAVKAYLDEDDGELRRLLGLKPWEISPLDAVGPCVYPLLRDDLTAMLSGNSTPIVLIKANVCRLLEPWLNEDGFNVLNRGSPVYFPSNGSQGEFH